MATYTKEQAERMVCKRVTVNSHRVSNAAGVIHSYSSVGHHFYVVLDEPYRSYTGKMTRHHKCNAGNVTPL